MRRVSNRQRATGSVAQRVTPSESYWLHCMQRVSDHQTATVSKLARSSESGWFCCGKYQIILERLVLLQRVRIIRERGYFVMSV